MFLLCFVLLNCGIWLLARLYRPVKAMLWQDRSEIFFDCSCCFFQIDISCFLSRFKLSMFLIFLSIERTSRLLFGDNLLWTSFGSSYISISIKLNSSEQHAEVPFSLGRIEPRVSKCFSD